VPRTLLFELYIVEISGRDLMEFPWNSTARLCACQSTIDVRRFGEVKELIHRSSSVSVLTETRLIRFLSAKVRKSCADIIGCGTILAYIFWGPTLR
jgi:hypothetical protein